MLQSRLPRVAARRPPSSAYIGGIFVLIAAIVGSMIAWHPWSTSSNVSSTKTARIIAGTVVEEGSNKSVPQAEITLVGRNEHYYSEGNGNFRINLTQNNIDHVRIRVVKPGYETFDMSYEIPNENIIAALQKIK